MATAYFDFRIQDQEGNYIEVDWDDTFRVEFYDSTDTLRFTATINSNPPIGKATDSLGPYYYVNGIDITGWAIGMAKAYIYAKYKGENIVPYPTIIDAFEILESYEVLEAPTISYRQDDFGLISYTFTYSDTASAVLPDWDTNLKIEVYDSFDNLRATYTITTDPPIRKASDADGNPYIYVDEIDLIDFPEGDVTTKIYAFYKGVAWTPYPIVFKPFKVVFYQLDSSKHPKALLFKLRRYLRDYPELNRIIKAEETSDRMLREALRAAFDEWNFTPPRVGMISPDNYPQGIEPVLIQIAACYVLESVISLRARNRLQYSDGGVTIDEEAGAIGEEKQLLQFLRQQAQLAMLRYKENLNISQGWGGVESEYSLVYTYWWRGNY